MKLSLRVQIVGLGTLVLLAGMLAYLVLAVRLVARDKRAYVYDVSGALVAARAEELRVNLEALGDRLLLVAEQGRQRDEAALDLTVRSLVQTDSNLLAVELWEQDERGFERRYRMINPEALAQAGLPLGTVAALRDSEPLPFDRLLAVGSSLQNNSIPPGVPLLTLAVADAQRRFIAVADLQPQRLMRLFGASTYHDTYAIDGRGELILHSQVARMVTGRAPLPAALVETAFVPEVERGVQEVSTPAGTLITAFARVDADLAVIAEFPEAIALRAVADLTTQAVLFAALVALVALVMSLLLSQRIVAPLRRLHIGATRISQGNLGVTLPEGGAAEVAALTAAFNRMSTALADRESRYLGLVGSLGAGVAHEINNPLTVTMTNQDFIATQLDTVVRAGHAAASTGLSEALVAVREAQAATKRVKGIVTDLEAFSRTADEPDAVVDLALALDQAADLVQHEIQYRARLTRAYSPGPAVKGSYAQLSQVFVNLLVHAARAIPEGDADRQEVRVAVTAQGAEVRIEITDTGAGMPPEVVERAFDPFFLDAGGSSPVGLALCHAIVTRLGGGISLTSAVGRGTTVRIDLPTTRERPTPARRTPLPRARGPQARVLVVDDDLLVRNILGRLLAKDHQVHVVATAGEALATLEAGADYDIILCDLMMPVVTGMDLYATLAERYPDLTGRVVFMTGAAFTARAEEFIRTVGNRCLRKPFDFDELQRLVAKSAERRAAER